MEQLIRGKGLPVNERDYSGDNFSLSGDWSDMPEEENSQLGDSSGENNQLQDLPENS